jgi:DNA-binding beta-propeller fold protein YncE
MSISKVYVTTAITAIVIAIATSTTITFPNVAIFATPLFGPEGNDTTTDTTTPPETVGQQEQQTIHITKDGTNSYIISGGSSSVGSFDTTYRIAGERSAIRSAEDLIITTITEDFSSSPTIGYVIATNMTTSSGATNATTATLPNPFATPQQITERISSELRRVIAEGESGTTEGQNVEIKCDFRMSLEDMRCHYIPLLEAAAGDLAATTPTNTTDTGTAGG